MGITGKIVFLVNIMLAIVTFLSYLTPLINPKFYWIFSIIGLFFPVYLVLHVLFILLWFFRDWKKSYVSIICLILGFQHIRNYVGFNAENPVIDEATTLTVSTYNLSYGYFLIEKNKIDKKSNLNKIRKSLENLEDTDIICFQEVGNYVFEAIKSEFPNHKIYRTKKGVVILSKYPFGEKGIIDFGSITNSCIWADIKIKGEKVRIYNFHLQSNKVSKEADEIVENLQKNEDVKWYEDVKDILRKYKNTNISRSKQIQKIVNHINECPHPYIIGTDMNDVPMSYIYRQVSAISQDAFSEKGRGLGTTYKGNIPFLRIDYIFYSPPFRCDQYKSLDTDVSDHEPVVATLNYPFENE
jgi:endonuclease/exonuclease/phosphatase family metal-dependent hydrolase